MTNSYFSKQLSSITEKGNLRILPKVKECGYEIIKDGKHMLNLSSNDYLGLAGDTALKEEFLSHVYPESSVLLHPHPVFLPGTLASMIIWKNNWQDYSIRKPHWYSIAVIMLIAEYYLRLQIIILLFWQINSYMPV